MAHDHLKTFYISGALAGAVGFCIPLADFIADPEFPNLWILYLGNFILMAVVQVSVQIFQRKKEAMEGLWAIFGSGLRITLYSILLSAGFAAILLLLHRHISLLQAPANMMSGNASSLLPILFMNIVLVNFFVGAFSSFIAAVTTKSQQESADGN
jgi:hypothetical protein